MLVAPFPSDRPQWERAHRPVTTTSCIMRRKQSIHLHSVLECFVYVMRLISSLQRVLTTRLDSRVGMAASHTEMEVAAAAAAGAGARPVQPAKPLPPIEDDTVITGLVPGEDAKGNDE